MGQSGLVLVIPEAELRYGTLRRQFDPQATRGVPAHVTVLFPFMPPELLDDEVRRRLVRLFKQHSPFVCRFSQVERFPATTWLPPVPAEPIVQLTKAVVAEFPDYQPYGGAHASLIPHLTIADGDAAAADIAEKQVREDLEQRGPVSAHCGSVRLLVDAGGTWKAVQDFSLAGHQG